jgi:Bacterial type II and III secretion system protein
MIRVFAICALICISSFAVAETSPNHATVAPQPTPAVAPAVSACNDAHCDEAAQTAASDQPKSKQAILRQKLAEMNCLQSEIESLRRDTGTPQVIHINVQAIEVSRTKLRRLGVDFAAGNKPSQLAEKRMYALFTGTDNTGGFRVFENSGQVDGYIELLLKNNVAKVLADPSIMTTSGRSANFHAGGQLPIPASADSNQPISFMNYGTEVDLLATAVGDSRVKIELRARISEIDESRSLTVGDDRVPALSTRQIDTGIELAYGQTAVLSGLIQRRHETIKHGKDVAVTENEIELLFLVTPNSAERFAAEHGHNVREDNVRDAPRVNGARGKVYRTAIAELEVNPRERSLQVPPRKTPR